MQSTLFKLRDIFSSESLLNFNNIYDDKFHDFQMASFNLFSILFDSMFNFFCLINEQFSFILQ